MNANKSKSLLFSYKHDHPQFSNELNMHSTPIDSVVEHEHAPGRNFNYSNLSWKSHITLLHEKASTKLNLLKGLKYIL